MATAKRRPKRVYEQEGRTKAFAAARLAIAENLSFATAAERLDARISSVQEAATVLRHGTPEEIAAVEAGDMALGRLTEEIRKRTTVEERKQAARPPVYTPQADPREFDAEVWAKLRDALDALTSLPLPADVAIIVKKNVMRHEAVGRKLLTAHTWLEEFTNAWTS